MEIDGDRLFAIAVISGRFDKEIAALKRQGIEEMLIEWIDRTINEIPIDALPDEQVLVFCNLQMGEQQQRLFSDLQARNNEGLLNTQEVKKLNELMQVYRHGSVRKAKAMQVAVMRGLIPSKIAPNLESNSDRLSNSP